jgi:hypothetical protein
LNGLPVSSATLNFNGHSLNNDNAVNLEVIPLAADWSAAGSPPPTYNHTTTGTSITGNNIAAGLSGTDHTKDYSIDITQVVRNWMSGTWTNHGLQIRVDSETTNNGVGINTSGSGAIQLVVQEAPLTILDAYEGPNPDDFTIEWNSLPGESYRIETTDNLQGLWNLLAEVTGAADSTTSSYTHNGALSLGPPPRRFYHIVYPAN